MDANSPRITQVQPAHASMASGPSMQPSGKKFDINTLMSPPDIPLDSFNQTQLHNVANKPTFNEGKPPMPMSPPISPYSKPISSPTEVPVTPLNQTIKDPVLYPVDDNVPSSPSQLPLFAINDIDDHRRIVDSHVRARSLSTVSELTLPKREEYELALTFRSQVMKHYTANPKAWLRRERALLQADKRASAQRFHAIMPAHKPSSAPKPRAQRNERVSKPQSNPRPIRTHPTHASVSVSGPVRPAPTARAVRVSATPEPSRRVVAPNREDKDFKALPNYCPPLESLPNRPNSLKVDWKGQPIDLSGDPFVSMLHGDEVLLAGNLRLDCATYLTSKRRIFERRLQCLRSGKEFRKTDAQQACKIDVNKASKLWTAFDKVGWLDAEWVRKYL